MITLDEYHELAKSMLSPETVESPETILVRLRPNMQVAVRRSAVTEENKKKFIEAMKQIPKIEEGPSYIHMAGADNFFLSQHHALYAIAIGKALGVWDVVPYVMGESFAEAMFASDAVGVFPMCTGLRA